MKLFWVLLLVSLSTAASAAAEIPSTFFGMHILHAVNGSTGWPNVQFGTVRLWDSGVDWREIATARGTYNWSNFDRWMTLAEQHNVELVYTFGRVPSWANGGKGTMVPMTNMQDWDDFVRAVVTRAGGRVKYWEIWNEPNDTHFWTGDINTLLTMAQRARQIIRSIDPNAVILTPTPTWTTTSAYQWMDQYLKAGGGQYADIITFHGYVNASPESIDSVAANMRRVMDANGQGQKPLWDTEASWSLGDDCGKSTCDPDEQAAFLVRHYMLHLSRNVQRYYWYAWEDSWGTLWSKSEGVRKPAIAYQQVYNWLVGATLSNACSANSSSTWTCEITRPNGYQGLVVWNPKTTVSFTAPSQYVQYRDINGGKAAVPTNGVVSVGFKPILLETNNPTAPPGTPPPTTSANFSISASSSEALLVPIGQSASIKLTISPQGGAFNNAIQLACSGLPAGSTCKITPATVTPGANPATATLTISADASLASTSFWQAFAAAMCLPLFGATMIGGVVNVKRKLVVSVVLVAAVIGLVACGGATKASTPSAPKTYSATVTATSGAVLHSLVVPFTLK